MDNEYIRISELNPIPEDWTEEQVAQFMSDGLLPVSDTTSGITYKVLVGFMLSYAIGNSVTKESISYEFNESTSYTKDSLCIYERDLYIAREDMQAGAWDSNKWTKIPITVLINKLALFTAVKYNSNNTYGVNDFCTYDFTLYKCKNDNVTGSWDSTKWNKVDVGTELKSLLNWIESHSKLSQFTDDITQSSFLYTGTAPISGTGVYDFGKSVISAQYNPSSTYNKNYVCFNNGTLYKCLEDSVTGAWNSTKWKQTTIADVLTKLSDLDVEEYTTEYIDGLFPNDSVVIGGREYHYVQIGNQLWLTENLDYTWSGLGIGGSERYPTTPNAWYYDNNKDTYGIDGTYKCGLLYNWIAAKYLEDNKATLLPDGWRVPTYADWNALKTTVSTNGGAKLKALDNSITSNWPSNWNGTNDYGFNGIPHGNYWGSFNSLGSYGWFWTSTEYDEYEAYCTFLAGTDAILHQDERNKTDYAFALRLVKDVT